MRLALFRGAGRRSGRAQRGRRDTPLRTSRAKVHQTRAADEPGRSRLLLLAASAAAWSRSNFCALLVAATWARCANHRASSAAAASLEGARRCSLPLESAPEGEVAMGLAYGQASLHAQTLGRGASWYQSPMWDGSTRPAAPGSRRHSVYIHSACTALLRAGPRCCTSRRCLSTVASHITWTAHPPPGRLRTSAQARRRKRQMTPGNQTRRAQSPATTRSNYVLCSVRARAATAVIRVHQASRVGEKTLESFARVAVVPIRLRGQASRPHPPPPTPSAGINAFVF